MVGNVQTQWRRQSSYPATLRLRLARLVHDKGFTVEKAWVEIARQESSGAKVLAADPDEGVGKNHDRAEGAARAIAAFMDATGADPDTALVDLLASLQHLSDRVWWDFEDAIKKAKRHYVYETSGAKPALTAVQACQS